MERAPVLFVGHGSPMNAITDNPARHAWKQLGSQLGKPKAIIAVSAHWTSKGGTKVNTQAVNRQIYDMYGFPQELYDLRYEPKGNPALAGRVATLLEASPDTSWGIDHGVWSILCNMYPACDVPVVMVSTDVTATPAKLYGLGRKLGSLRDEGYAILASGNVVHNLGKVGWDMQDGYPWADAFDKEIEQAVCGGNHQKVMDYASVAGSRLAVPTPEHFLPLIVALGAIREADKATSFNAYRELGSMSMTSFLWK